MTGGGDEMSATPLMLSPSGLMVFIACEHATALELARTPKPDVADPQAALIRRKGDEHERGYLDELRSEGRSIREVEFAYDWEASARATEEAIFGGADVIYQGVFADGRWRGIADFLERQPDGSYEAVDT